MSTTTAYHAQSDGQTERANQELEQYLRSFVNDRQDNWDTLLPNAEFSHNNAVHASTHQVPFMTNYGRLPRMGFEPRNPRSTPEPGDDFADRMADGLAEAQAALEQSKAEYALYYNRRRSPAPDFQPGDLVWLDHSDIKTTRPSAKLAHRRLGPFAVERQVGKGAYKLKLPPRYSRLHPVFPVVKLTPALPDPIPGRRSAPPPPPVLVDGEEHFTVEKILDSRVRRGRLQYLVKWKGYDDGHNSWEPREDVASPALVKRFHSQHPTAPRHISATSFASIPFRPRSPTLADLSANWRSTHRGVAP
jgi:Chromo (CHRromatin Organisation MOdifier) domain